jgi:hypothetical protein
MKHSRIITPELANHLIQTLDNPIPKPVYENLEYIKYNWVFVALQRRQSGYDKKNILVGRAIQYIRNCWDDNNDKWKHINALYFFNYLKSIQYTEDLDEKKDIIKDLLEIIQNTGYMPLRKPVTQEPQLEDTLIFMMSHVAPECLEKLAKMGFRVMNADMGLWIRAFLSYHYRKGMGRFEAVELLDYLYRLGIISMSYQMFCYSNIPLDSFVSILGYRFTEAGI